MNIDFLKTHQKTLHTQFIGKKLSKIRFQPENPLIFVTGSWDEFENRIEFWQISDENLLDENLRGAEVLKERIEPICDLKIEGDVSEMRFLSDPTKLLISTSAGQLLISHFLKTSLESEKPYLKKLNSWTLPAKNCTAFSLGSNNKIIAASENGEIFELDLTRGDDSLRKLNENAQNYGSIYCMGQIERDLVVTGGISGQLCIFDLRDRSKLTLLSTSNLGGQSVTALGVHPVENFIMAAGTENGALSICDLREFGRPIVNSPKINLESGQINEIQFHPNYPDNLFLCAENGSLLQWDGAELRYSSIPTESKIPKLSQQNPWKMGPLIKDRVPVENLAAGGGLLALNSLDFSSQGGQNRVLAGGDSGAVILVEGVVLR